MFNSKQKKVISIGLTVSLLALSLAGCGKQKTTGNEILDDARGTQTYVQQNYTTLAENVKKQETVYINLNSDGTVKKINVTDWLHTDTPQTVIEDVSSLENITNVKTLTPADVKDGKLYWDMDTTDLYYSGTTEKPSPLNITIRYFLDDVEMTAEEIAGKSGNVKIQIDVTSALKKAVTINKKSYDIYCPMLFVGGMILPEDKFTNVNIVNGTALSDGSKQIAFFTGVPGADESLGLSELNLAMLNALTADSFTITATVTDFELGNIMFAAAPLSAVGSIGTGTLPESVDDIKGVLSDIEDVQKALNGLDINKMVSVLYGDSNKFDELIGSVNTAVRLYRENEKLLKTVSTYMTDENLKKLEKLADDLSKTDLDAISATLNDPAVAALLEILPKLSSSLSEVATLAKDLNEIMPILQSLSNDMNDPEIKQSLDNMPETLNELQGVLKTIDDNKEVLEMINDLSSDDKAAQVDALMKTVSKYTTLDSLPEEKQQLLAEKMKEWLTYGNEYDIFTEKTSHMTSNVVFTYKTDAISVPEQSSAEQTAETQETVGFVTRIKNLFK